MKICTKCQTRNEEDSRICISCGFRLPGGNENEEEERDYIRREMERQERKGRIKKTILLGLCFLFFIAATVHLGTIALALEKIEPFLLRCFWYLPGVLLLVLPYDAVFMRIQSALGRKASGCPDILQMTARVLGVLAMIAALIALFDFAGAQDYYLNRY